MIYPLPMICHMLEPSAITPEPIDSAAMLLKDELVILRNRVETRHNVSYFGDLAWHDILHHTQLKVRV